MNNDVKKDYIILPENYKRKFSERGSSTIVNFRRFYLI